MNADVATRAIRDLYGVDLVDEPPVVHVAAVWAAPDGALFNMRIGAGTPTSATDAFALAVARARADAIVTTGRILRDEPDLRFTDARAAAWGLDAWRRDRLGRETPARIVVLTRGEELDATHPALAGRSVLVLTSRAAARGLAARLPAPRIEVVGREAPGLLDAVAYLRDERGVPVVLVEAGPSTSQSLYAPPGHVDELMLSTCHAPVLAEGVRGDAFPGAEAFARAGLVEVAAAEREEQGVRWCFALHRRVRRAGAPGS